MNLTSEVELASDSSGKDPYVGRFKVNLQSVWREPLKVVGT